GVGRQLEVAETLVGDQHRDLRAVDVVVDLLLRRQARARNGLDPSQHVLPVLAAHVLRRRVHLRQVIGDRTGAVLVVGQLVGAPLPLAAVDGGQALAAGAYLGRLRATPER